ncbi:MAG: potassium transporter TrkA [Gallionellales bacterium 35-53-114]|jgi:Trk K+ transport system NAD-binding subunit|nr:MAG: potassium transporter TrkA [Gallionellales bacterium 35-53-114]OYZ63230.1 MAG: potassium transporter TrkA [Gallionellales bacterium 24-53-125]OZB08696.1 MAG: potassium transporter TrkA [Gallionellales bacterium 39-52-133]HQS57445.1 NAD-binding protein [Gallionellaceae bacterium]HQS74367.1 NAD-binding protein [Gallionellaceae bacterium]
MHNIVYILLRRIHLPLIVLVCVYAIAILGFVLIPGMDDKGNPWNMGFFHAFYFVSYMGTTIGFGEIPYPFTDAQRLWATVNIYATVMAWLYGIGSALSLLQDSAFQAVLRENAFRRAVKRIHEPFYIVCGYGDTGTTLVHALCEEGYRSVVIDIDPGRIIALELEDLPLPVPGLYASAAEPETLVKAGLMRPNCAGVIALTNVDDVNLNIAISTSLLRPQLQTIARAESHAVEANMLSFGSNQVLNPFHTFAGRLALALHAPGMYLLLEWMTAVPHEKLREPLFPPHGRWILCGYGRFGKAVHERLLAEGIEVTVVEAAPEATHSPEGTISGSGTEAETLLAAGIKNAAGIVAGTDNDANNLSIIMTARELNSRLFLVARQNQHQNDIIFNAARLDLVMQRGKIIANKIFALTTTPLLADFLLAAGKNSNEWANQLVSRIGGISGEEVPQTWVMSMTPADSPALYSGIARGKTVLIADLYRNPRNRDERLPFIALLLKRADTEILLPDDDTILQRGDRILMCGRFGTEQQAEWVAKNHNVFDYLHSGEERAGGSVWRWLRSRKEARQKV